MRNVNEKSLKKTIHPARSDTKRKHKSEKYGAGETEIMKINVQNDVLQYSKSFSHYY